MWNSRPRPCAQSNDAGVAEAHELGEERARLGAEDDARERGVLAHDAHPGVSHDEHQESRLALGEALRDDGLNLDVEGHRPSSSSMPRPRRRPPPPARPDTMMRIETDR